jgi:hypothetical protein
MKKTALLLTVLLSIMLSNTFAQIWPCVPDESLTYNGISPETLPPATAGYDYWSVLSFKIPKDSSITANGSSIGITIDSARFLYAAGIPAGFEFHCNTPNCVWKGGSKGCALFTGKVDSTYTDSVAEYPMIIYTMTWFRFTGGSDQFSRIDSGTNFVFRIKKYNGIAEFSSYEPLKAYPNPTTGMVNIELRNLQNTPGEIRIMDALGKLVYENTLSKNDQFLNTLSVDLSDYPKGLYMITLRSGDKIGLSKILLK